MVDKPSIGARPSARQAGIEAAYGLRLRGFDFFLVVISSRVLTGIASIRRASSSSDIGGSSVCFLGRALFMVGVRHHG